MPIATRPFQSFLMLALLSFLGVHCTVDIPSGFFEEADTSSSPNNRGELDADGLAVDVVQPDGEGSTDVSSETADGDTLIDVSSPDNGDGNESNCTVDEDCTPLTQSPCKKATCKNGVCIETHFAANIPCELPDTLNFDTECIISSSCNGAGLCTPNFTAEDVNCLPNLGGQATQEDFFCRIHTCNGAGTCDFVSINESQRCGQEVSCKLSYCTEGSCTAEEMECNDKISCTEDHCQDIICEDDTFEVCSLTGIFYSEKTNKMEEASGTITCNPDAGAGPEAPDTTFCKGQCGGQGADGICYCDSACSGLGDCCSDVCFYCGLGDCEAADLPIHCVATLCNSIFIGDEAADLFGCLTFPILKSKIEEKNGNGPVCDHSVDSTTCDDLNSCSHAICDEGAEPGTSGCSYEAKNPGDTCSGKELCYENPGVCVPDGQSDVGLKCEGGTNKCEGENSPCTTSTCMPSNGDCANILSWTPGEEGQIVPTCTFLSQTDTGNQITPECNAGICSPCNPENGPCEGPAECLRKSPYGVTCLTDYDCTSADGLDWKCKGQVGLVGGTCRLPCGSDSCAECLGNEEAQKKFQEIAQDICKSPEWGGEILKPNFGALINTHCPQCGLVSSPIEQSLCLQGCLSSLSPEKIFLKEAYLCDLAFGSNSCGELGLCSCTYGCSKANECCPDYCESCGGQADVCDPASSAYSPDIFAVASKPSCQNQLVQAYMEHQNAVCEESCNQCLSLKPVFGNVALPLCSHVKSGSGNPQIQFECIQPCPSQSCEGECTEIPVDEDLFQCDKGSCTNLENTNSEL